MQKLRPLRAGDTIGIFAPGSPTRRELIEQGAEWLQKQGFEVLIPLAPSINYGRIDGSFSSATVEERLEALYALLDNDEVATVLCARGAYGSAELLPKLDFKRVAAAKKAIVGYSDVTALVSSIPQLADIPAIHGPTLTKEVAEARHSPEALQSALSLLSLLKGESVPALTGQTIRMGEGRGKLIVGNLTVLTTLLGTPYEPDFTGAVLVIEDTGESPYRIHRMLTHLQLAGKLSDISALCFGRFSNCEGKNPPTLKSTLERFISEQLNHVNYPVIAGLEVGHGGINLPLPCGVLCEISAQSTQGSLSVSEIFIG